MNNLLPKPQNGKSYSGFGIVSCLFALIFFGSIIGSVYMDAYLWILICLLGLGFGIAGILQKYRNNVFLIVGIIVN
ncbi:MAG: hypothetical protein WBA93_23645 [Microcoleaceae cyanobacterium]